MGIEAIITRIHEDAQAEVDRIGTTARGSAEKISRDGERQAELEYQAIVAAGARENDQIRARHRSQALISSRRRIREMKESLAARCFSLAAEEFTSIHDSARYPEILRRLIREGTDSLGSDPVTIQVNAADKTIASEIIAAINASGIEISLGSDPINTTGGAVIFSNRGIRIDNTFEARLERYQKDLLFQVSKILLGEEGDRNG